MQRKEFRSNLAEETSQTGDAHRAKVHRASWALNKRYKKEFELGETTQVYNVESRVHNFVILRGLHENLHLLEEPKKQSSAIGRQLLAIKGKYQPNGVSDFPVYSDSVLREQ